MNERPQSTPWSTYLLPMTPPRPLSALSVAELEANAFGGQWCAASHGHQMLQDGIDAINELTARATAGEADTRDAERWRAFRGEAYIALDEDAALCLGTQGETVPYPRCEVGALGDDDEDDDALREIAPYLTPQELANLNGRGKTISTNRPAAIDGYADGIRAALDAAARPSPENPPE